MRITNERLLKEMVIINQRLINVFEKLTMVIGFGMVGIVGCLIVMIMLR